VSKSSDFGSVLVQRAGTQADGGAMDASSGIAERSARQGAVRSIILLLYRALRGSSTAACGYRGFGRFWVAAILGALSWCSLPRDYSFISPRRIRWSSVQPACTIIDYIVFGGRLGGFMESDGHFTAGRMLISLVATLLPPETSGGHT
jgi:hypothetical protein